MMQDLRQHMALLEHAIAGAFVNDSLPVHLLGGSQGPHTLTFALRLYQPTKANLAKALKLAGAVEAAIGDSSVRIYSESGVLFVEVPSPLPVIVSGHTLRGEGLAVPIGMTARRAIAGIDFEVSPHVLLVGPTNAGKTTAARCIAYQLARQNPARHCRFIVSTFKPKDWKAFAQLDHTFAVIVTPVETEQAICWLKGVMYSRTAKEIDTPQVFLFLDDLLNLLGAANGDVAGDLRELASLGRAAGIHLVIGTQRLGESGAGGAAITGNIRTRLVFGTADAGDAAQFTGRGESGAEKLGRYKGDALLVVEGSTQRVAVAYVSDDDLVTLHQNPDEWRPWLKVQAKLLRDDDGTKRDVNANRHAVITAPSHAVTTYHPAVSRDKESGEEKVENAPSSNVMGRVTKLADRPPTPDEQQVLRMKFAELGSKRAVLKAVWGGVVNADGNTPKTRRWLAAALAEEVQPCGKP